MPNLKNPPCWPAHDRSHIPALTPGTTLSHDTPPRRPARHGTQQAKGGGPPTDLNRTAPAALAEFSQTKAWVSTVRWTAASASTEQRTRIRGSPARSARRRTPVQTTRRRQVTAGSRSPVRPRPPASCTRGTVRHWRSPYGQPASRLAQPDTVNSAAAVPAAPCSTANHGRRRDPCPGAPKRPI